MTSPKIWGLPISLEDIVRLANPESAAEHFTGRDDRYAQAARAAIEVKQRLMRSTPIGQSHDYDAMACYAYACATKIVCVLSECAEPALRAWEARTKNPAHLLLPGRESVSSTDANGNRTEPYIEPVWPNIEQAIFPVWQRIGDACKDPSIEHVWICAGRITIDKVSRLLLPKRNPWELRSTILAKLDGHGDHIVFYNHHILDNYVP